MMTNETTNASGRLGGNAGPPDSVRSIAAAAGGGVILGSPPLRPARQLAVLVLIVPFRPAGKNPPWVAAAAVR